MGLSTIETRESFHLNWEAEPWNALTSDFPLTCAMVSTSGNFCLLQLSESRGWECYQSLVGKDWEFWDTPKFEGHPQPHTQDSMAQDINSG